MEKSSKTGREKKGFTSIFACFLTSTAKVGFLEGGWALGYVSTQICDFPNISLFAKILSFKAFDNSYTKFSIVDITFRFTCG